MMKLVVVGPGLIGRSVALAARRAHPEVVVGEIDRGESLDEIRTADLVVLATPVDVILWMVGEHRDILRDRVIVDTGSTKRAIVHAARAAALEGFVGGHPMAGAARSGPAAARADLFDARPWFLVPHGARADAVLRVQAFIEGLGAIPVVMGDDGAEHDRVMAAVSHLPQVVASILMTVAEKASGSGIKWAGAGLKDTTRLAASDGTVWASILGTNAEALEPLLRDIAGELHRVAGSLKDAELIDELFTNARRARARLDAPAR